MNDDARQDLSKRDVKHAVKEALDELLGLGEVRMAARFSGGSVVIKPAKADTQEKVIPIDVLFRDRDDWFMGSRDGGQED